MILHKLSYTAGMSLGAIAATVGLSQSRASYHVKQLVDAGLLHTWRHRQWTLYGLVDEALIDVASLLPPSDEADAERARDVMQIANYRPPSA